MGEIKALTVNMLYEEMRKRVKNGQGDYVVFVTDDEEANGYHALWYNGSEPNKMGKEERKFVEESNCDFSLVEKNPDKAIYIG